MGLFSRKSNGKSQGNGNSSDGNLSTNNTNGDSRSPFSMKRANGNPADHATIPDVPLPKPPDPNADPAAYLKSIYAVRDRSRLVLDKGLRNELRHFDVDMDKFGDTARFVVSIIKV